MWTSFKTHVTRISQVKKLLLLFIQSKKGKARKSVTRGGNFFYFLLMLVSRNQLIDATLESTSLDALKTERQVH